LDFENRPALSYASLRSSRYRALQAALVDIRLSQGMTQSYLAMRLSRPQSFVAKYECGERRLDIFEFIDIVGGLGGEPHQVLFELITTTNPEND
jgi:transcriptional regulator with XRE-family HTH domain